MTTLTFYLDNKTLKTKIIPSNYPDITILYDTGADTPVWCNGEDELLDLFPAAMKMNSKFILSGFGLHPEIVDVYKIPSFVDES